MMKKLLLFAVATAALPLVASAQDAKVFLGRWDMTATPATGTPYPQWMELLEKNGKVEGRVQPKGSKSVSFQVRMPGLADARAQHAFEVARVVG